MTLRDDSRVTIHMVASLDGFIARTIDCYFMGSRTYETALAFEAKGLGWAYGDKPSAQNAFVGLADEVRYSIVPILIGDGIPFFDKLGKDVPLHLAEVKSYRSGMVELCYEVRR
jgi:hypothetical protein